MRRAIVRNLISPAHQAQPCGVDLSLRRVLRWTSPATIDFDNSRRQSAKTSEILFSREAETVTLPQGSYLVEFNESVDIPLDFMGQLFARSSLWRSGALLTAGAVDSGYKGALGALLDVRNPNGIILCKDAKLGQIIMQGMEEKVEGYGGIYQSSESAAGRDGQASTLDEKS
ncbi:deoxyuridine 5'-triphosphate nucleotidohydrolase [Candidatus Bathyarchaeota archaeon]|nr:deoxyuridine 5'-triphosphate nucleotidohydrolase [Candidatus Bathyarchaeota archaeon]